MNNVSIAALIRGFCIDLTGKPQFVVHETFKEGNIPVSAMIIELNPAESDKNAAGIIRSSYEIWKKSADKFKISDNQGKPGESENTRLIPACAALKIDGKYQALYWIGNDLDAARKKLKERDASPGREQASRVWKTVRTEERASVVKNKIALVTGGAQGIGEEIVRNLTSAGAVVFIADLNIDGAEKLAQEINAAEERTAALAVCVNVSDESSVKNMFDAVAMTAGGLDLCVSNAGVLKAGSVLEQELSDFRFVTDINYTGFFVISKYAGRLLQTQHFAALNWKTDIIQINSKSGLEGSNKNGAYAGGKFGGIGLVASFAMELIEYNIKVNAICPGNFLDGPLWSHPEKGLFVQYLKTGKVPGAKSIEDVRTFYEAKVPMKRGCTGKDLVRALYYIIEQEYETGQALPVTGGQIMLH